MADLKISQAYGTTQNRVIATPSGSNGAPTLRALVALDIPTLTLSKISDAGTAAALNVGTSASQVMQLTAASKIPAVDGSLITNMTKSQVGLSNVDNTADASKSFTASQISDATTVGANTLKLTNPGAITFLRINADNTVTALSASAFRTAIGAGTGFGDAFTSGTLAQFAATTSSQLAGVMSDETGSGALVFATSPTLVTPLLGTPTSGVLTNCTGLPVSTGISGLGAGVSAFLATPSSANLATAVTNETGSGALVFATSPTLVTPVLGTPASGTLTNCSGLPGATGITGVIPIANLATGTPSGSKFIRDDGTLAVPAGGGGGSQTPWTSDIDADGFALQYVSKIELGSGSTKDSTIIREAANQVAIKNGANPQRLRLYSYFDPDDTLKTYLQFAYEGGNWCIRPEANPDFSTVPGLVLASRSTFTDTEGSSNAAPDVIIKGNQALVGGGNLTLGGGFAVRSFNVDDYASASGITLILIVDGVTYTLTEGSDFTAETDNATTAGNVKTAIDGLNIPFLAATGEDSSVFLHLLPGNKTFEASVTGPGIGVDTSGTDGVLAVTTKLELLSGIAQNGAGFKHQSVSTGSIAALSSAAVTLTWSTAFPDASYTPMVSVIHADATVTTLRVHHIESISASAVVVRIYNDHTTTAKTGTLHVVGIHV